MNYTESLITVLNKKEIEQIRSSELTKAERTIFETLVTNRLPEHQRKKITAKSCGMTDAYFRKTNAEFLKMMFSIITPEGGLTTLRLLKNRFLLPLFRHEMKKQESILLSFSTNDQKRIFYRSALVLSGGFPFAQGLKIGSLLRQVRKNFFSSGVEISSADRIFFESIILEWDINYLHYLKKENKFRKERKRFAMLATLFSETENIDMDAAHSFHATALKLSSVDPLDKEAMLFHSRTIYELTTKNPKEVNALSYGKGKYHYVSTLLNLGMTEEAYQLLIQAAKSDPEGIMRPNILSMYIVTAITLDRYDEIEPLMLRAYDRFTEENNDAYLMFIVDQYIAVALHQQDLIKAKKYIDIRHHVITQKQIFNEILFRMHETAYYFFCGDFVYCSALLEKNLPFFYRNSPEKGDDIRLVFLKLIRARISELEKNKPIPKKLLDQRNFFLESTYLLLWKRLIDRILGETE